MGPGQQGRYLIAMIVILAFFAKTSKGLSRGYPEGVSFINFKSDEFSYLNITSLGSELVQDGSECGFACLGITSCFSYNLAAFPDINGKLFCELLSSDKYNNSDKFAASAFHHHFSIPTPCSSDPCMNSATCVAKYESNDYQCACVPGYVGKHCDTIVPLGSIPELPAESCSEIKASEGNEMVNGDYWIYSDGNGQTILARCEENWQKMNTEPVCFGARGNQYGAFNITKSGRLKTMKLIHKSGSVKCNSVDSASYWGCRNSENYGNNGLLTIIINAKKESVLPPAEDLKAHNHCDKKKHFYSLDGTYHTSPELVFRDLPNLLYVSRNQEFQIWYGKDWIDCWESGNSGKTCVDVYAWFV
ncbi:uncharacterized protein LOC144654006 [Oculina patagonica]